MNSPETNALDYFSGGVPAGATFKIQIDNLRKISTASSDGDKMLFELCLIGLTAYFEAFAKDLFSACVNICPELLNRPEAKNLNTSIDARRVLIFRDHMQKKLGFILAEKYDFGSARQINNHYLAILGLSPFSKKNAVEYDELLSIRNLMVHHGGVITSAFVDQQRDKTNLWGAAYYQSIECEKSNLIGFISFLDSIAAKLVKSSKSKLSACITEQGIVLDEERFKAVKFLDWYE